MSQGSTWFARYHDINGTLNGRRFKGTKILLYGPTCNLAITSHVAREIQFDESYKSAAGEDIDFCLRAMTVGLRTVHCESMKVTHDYQYTPGHHLANAMKFVRQFRKYARAESQLLKQFPSYFHFFAGIEEISSH